MKYLYEFSTLSQSVYVLGTRQENAPTSYTKQSCIASLHLCSRLFAHILMRVLENVLYSRNYEVRRRLATSNHK